MLLLHHYNIILLYRDISISPTIFPTNQLKQVSPIMILGSQINLSNVECVRHPNQAILGFHYFCCTPPIFNVIPNNLSLEISEFPIPLVYPSKHHYHLERSTFLKDAMIPPPNGNFINSNVGPKIYEPLQQNMKLIMCHMHTRTKAHNVATCLTQLT